MPRLTPEEFDRLIAANPDLAVQLQALKSQAAPNVVLAKLKAIGWGLLAAVTSPEAIKAEKSIAALALARAAILVPALAGIIAVIVSLLTGNGVTP